jgi:ABC-type dipeptide/oligopeptide/nickel transport system ATPase subunit
MHPCDVPGVIDTRFADDALRARIVEKQVMQHAVEPRPQLARALEVAVANQQMQAAIEVVCVVKRSDTVLLRPVHFKIRKRLVVEATDQRMDMRVRALFVEVRRMLLARALEVPDENAPARAAVDARANALLAKLALDHKVQVTDGTFSTRALSTGQRKRLALVVAYLEDRPFYLFDEWAADQDPAFKAVFYEQLLPELRARGKTVVVITHDDRYFALADRVLKLDNGAIVNETRLVPQPVSA